MPDKSLSNYVKSMMQKGHDAYSIKNFLLKYGYSEREIDQAINSSYSKTIRHEIHLSHTTILVVIFVIASIIGALSFFYINPKQESQLLDLNLEPILTTVEPGESITFVKELSNLGSSKRYDVVINQELINPLTGKSITQKVETRAIETFGSTQTKILVPKDAKPGDYILRAIVEYDGKKAVATLPVKIIPAPKEAKEAIEAEKLDCNDNNPCTSDVVENGKCANKQIVPCCGNLICEQNENCASDCAKTTTNLYSTATLDEIKDTARTNAAKALQQCSQFEVPDLKDTCIANIGEVQRSGNYCSQIVSERIKDLCYSNIAKTIGDNTYCGKVSMDSRRDSCYMGFVLDNKDYSVCSSITNKQLRQSCESLKQLNELNQG